MAFLCCLSCLAFLCCLSCLDYKVLQGTIVDRHYNTLPDTTMCYHVLPYTTSHGQPYLTYCISLYISLYLFIPLHTSVYATIYLYKLSRATISHSRHIGYATVLLTYFVLSMGFLCCLSCLAFLCCLSCLDYKVLQGTIVDRHYNTLPDTTMCYHVLPYTTSHGQPYLTYCISLYISLYLFIPLHTSVYATIYLYKLSRATISHSRHIGYATVLLTYFVLSMVFLCCLCCICCLTGLPGLPGLQDATWTTRYYHVLPATASHT